MAAPAKKDVPKKAAPPPAPVKPPLKPAALRAVPADPAALLAEHVDELGALEKELVPIRPKLKRVEQLRELIRRRFESKPAGASFETRGRAYLATLGPQAFEASIDLDRLKKIIGLARYAEISRPTLKAIEESLAPDIVAKVVTHSYRGARPLKTFALNADVPADT